MCREARAEEKLDWSRAFGRKAEKSRENAPAAERCEPKREKLAMRPMVALRSRILAYNGKKIRRIESRDPLRQMVARWFIVEQRSIVRMANWSRRFGKIFPKLDGFGIGFASLGLNRHSEVLDISIIGRIAAVDYGTKRIGLAISDAEQKIASPAGMIVGAGGPVRDAARVVAWAVENAAAAIVVGMPFNMDGSFGQQAALTGKFVEQLRARTELPIEVWDERLTSFQADEWMRAAGLSKKQMAKRRDSLAAQVILTSYLRNRDGEPGLQ